MNDREKFLFDLNGYLVLEDVLTHAEVAAANAAIEHHADLISNRETGLSGNAAKLKGGEGRGEFSQNPLTFQHPWCDPFRRMFTHPRLIDVFNEVLGPGFRLDHGPGLIRMQRGTEGHRLHGGMTFDPSQYHSFSHGRMHAGLCVAAWQLTDVRAGDGGFVCIPGSHKANYRPPMEVLRLEQDWGCVHQVVAGAGSVLFFNEALVHRHPPLAARRPRTPLHPVQVFAGPHLMGFAPCPVSDCRSHAGGGGPLRAASTLRSHGAAGKRIVIDRIESGRL
jgi:ectoine hydroxylase-related dioxygenase (phytanoyl-CoA dioxygenase family)